MKKLALASLALTCAASVFAQGTVVFNNRVTGTLVTHVYLGGNAQRIGNGTGDTPSGTADWTGFTALSGAGYWSALLAANGANQAESSLQQATPTTTFRTGTAVGNIAGVTATLNNVPADAPVATIEMVAWDNSSGQYSTWALAKAAWNANLIAAGTSGTFNLGPIGGLGSAPTMTGLQSFNIYLVPEPTTFALAGLGAAALLIFRRRK
jgi:hypothetical protein